MAYQRYSQSTPQRPEGQSVPPTMTILKKGEKIAVISAYTNHEGKRQATITLCVLKPVPERISAIEADAIFGEAAVRQTTSVAEAITLAENYLSGSFLGGEVL